MYNSVTHYSLIYVFLLLLTNKKYIFLSFHMKEIVQFNLKLCVFLHNVYFVVK